jgi:ribonuclease M5
MVKIQEAIVVEGRYDKNTLCQIVDAPIIQTDGFGIMNDKSQLAFIRRVAEQRGVIILTDSDGAGFVIRNYLKGALPADHVKHAYIPDVLGKERRKSTPGKEGKMGVEGMTPEVILDCLKKAGATIVGETSRRCVGDISKADMFELGLSGGKGSKARRMQLLKFLDMPEHMSSNALLDALNMLYTKEEFLKLMDKL